MLYQRSRLSKVIVISKVNVISKVKVIKGQITISLVEYKIILMMIVGT